jgi:hypothetical protein
MGLPESARGAILDANRLMAFSLDTPVNVLVLYSEAGAELARIDHWWSARFPRGRAKNFNESKIHVVEDGTDLTNVMTAAKVAKYQVESATPAMSEPFEIRVEDKPEGGRLREWVLTLNRPKHMSKVFRGPIRQ